MAIPSSPDDPSKGTKLSCTLERQCSFFTAVLDMANELRREREQDRRVSRRCETRKKRKCQLHNKLGNDPVTSRRRLFCYLTFVGCQCLRPGELQRFTSERVKKKTWIIPTVQVWVFSLRRREQHIMGTVSLFNANTPQQTCQPKDTETFPHGHHVCCRVTLCFHVNTQDK